MEAIEFVDECTVHVRGGHGGNGVVAFRRESHVPLGGPAGGDGGRGGNVVFVADTNTSSLLDLHRRPHRRAQNGVHGEGMKRTGADGDDLVIDVPVGTVVRDHETGTVLADLAAPGATHIASHGGRGGRGNASFVNRFRKAPRFAEYGEQVEERLLRLELKLIADVGLVGFPSAGKSSLIAHLSAAKPKIAAYPFTTLTPNLGVVRAGDVDFVMADVPGLVPGASEGKGLGHQFLRHIERCAVLLHVLDTVPFESDRDPVSDLDALLDELREHDSKLLERRQVVALNKVDLPDGVAMAELIRPALEERGYEVFEISAVSGAGLDPLRFRLGALVQEERATRAVDLEVAAPTEVVITLREDPRHFEVEQDDEGRYHVRSPRFDRWVQMLPLDNTQAVRHLQGRLRRAGVERRLVEAGAREGDEIVIGGLVFEFDPELEDLPAEEREAILAGELDPEADEGWIEDDEAEDWGDDLDDDLEADLDEDDVEAGA